MSEHTWYDFKYPLSEASLRLNGLEQSCWTVHADAMQRLANGEDIIPLSIGDPDFNTPQYVINGLKYALKRNRTHYAPPSGEDSLKNALAELESNTSGNPIEPNQFTIFNGATACLHAVISCIADVGDNVVTAEPKYLGYDPTFACVGIELKTVPMDAPAFELDVDQVVKAIDDQTVAVLVNTPCNPTGNVVDPESLRKLARMCSSRGIWIISDEVYSQICFEKKHTSLLNVADSLDNVVVVDSLSKSHAMSGWRLGWTVTSPEFARHLGHFALGSFFSGSPFIQDSGAYAIKHNMPEVRRMCDEYRNRRDYTMQRVAEIPQFHARKPHAGMFVMVDVGTDGDPVARRLLDDVGVSVFPGSASGESSRNYVRVGLTRPVAELERAWDRIDRWVRQNL